MPEGTRGASASSFRFLLCVIRFWEILRGMVKWWFGVLSSNVIYREIHIIRTWSDSIAISYYIYYIYIYIYITRNEPLWFAMVVLISYKVMAPVSMVGQCRIQVWTPTVPSTTWKRPRLNEVEYLLVNVYSLLLKMAIYSGFSHKKNSDFP